MFKKLVIPERSDVNHKKIFISMLLFATVTLAQVTAAVESDKPRLAIIPLEAQDVSETDTSIATQYLTTEIIRQGRFWVLEREYMAEILEEQAMVLTCTDIECAIEIGRVLAAERVIVGSVARTGGNYVLTVRMIDVEKGSVIASTTERTGASGTALSNLAKDIGGRTRLNRIEEDAGTGWLWWTLGGVAAVAGGVTIALLSGEGGGEEGILPGWPGLPDE
jgi:TolB-like protein